MAENEQAAEQRPAGTNAAAIQPASEPEENPLSKLPPSMQAVLTQRRYERTVMVELSKTNWGEKLDLATRKAIADWGERHNIDVAQEIDVLGNRIYLNARRVHGLPSAALISRATSS